MKIRCVKCGTEWEVKGQVGVRDECPECAAYVHTCTNCAHYESATQSCAMPNTEEVRDREGQNFCEEFAFGPGRPASAPAPTPKPLPADEARRKFDSLFRDPDA